MLVLVLVLVLDSAGTRHAWSQGTPGSGSGSGSIEDEDAGAEGSGKQLVAPKDPKARGAWLHAQLDAALIAHPQLAKAKIAAVVVDLQTGEELYARAADQGMALASCTKLLTSTAALATLGGGFRWRTAIFADDLDDATGTVKGNLYVRGKGDPTLSAADLDALADDVAARGVRTVEGQLVIDGSYFDTDVEPPHYSDEPKERAGFRAPVAAFSVARSAVTITVTPDPGGLAAVRVEPDAGGYVRVTKAEVQTVTDKRTRVKLESRPMKDHLELEVTGQIRPADGSWDARRRIDDPARFAGEMLRRALAARGVRITRHALGSGEVPLTAKLLAAHDSLPLSAVLVEMNKHSDNFIAETLLKTLGAEARAAARAAPGATWADGLAAVRAALLHVGLTGTYRYENGSGLFGASEVSAHQLVALLRGAYGDYRIGPQLIASLPVGGEDGTLAKRWHDRPARGRVYAKTGTLDKVTTLAGFAGVDGRHVLAFAILVNDIPAGQRNPSRAMADDMVDAMVAYLEADR